MCAAAAHPRTLAHALMLVPDADVAKVTPAVHYTMGGMHINAVGEALAASADGTPQPVHGLFGAGEVTGGVHGGNRLAGNSLLECVVFGRRAGRRAARHALVGDGCGAMLQGRPAREPSSCSRDCLGGRHRGGRQAFTRTGGRVSACNMPSTVPTRRCS